MKKSKAQYLALLLVCVTVALLAVIPLQRGQADRSDWMMSLEDTAPLNSLTIPGTHDTGALHSFAEVSGKCQTLSVEQQLKIGVRFLDIRLQLVGDRLRVVHSFVDQMTDFEDSLASMVEFIRNHKSEFLILSIKEDASPKRADRDFTEVLESMLLSYPEISTAQSLPDTVGDARGKIHVAARYKNATVGIPCYDNWVDDSAAFSLGNIYVQDNYRVADTGEKIADVHRTYIVAQQQTYGLVLNFTSCYLETGFPPIYAGLPAHDINRDTEKSMAEYADGPLGVLVCDFMTAELAGAIIGRNFK